MEIFYQVFDKGMLEDGEGREIDFKNTIILLTSNVGTDTIMKLCADPDTMPDPTALAEAIRPDLLKVFKPALLGRMIIVPYYPLADDVMKQIIRLQLGRIGQRHGGEPQGPVQLQRRPRRHHRQPLQGSRERRPQRRPHPDRHAAARGLGRSSSRRWPRARRSRPWKSPWMGTGTSSTPSSRGATRGATGEARDAPHRLPGLAEAARG